MTILSEISYEKQFRQDLLEGEQVVWSGRPRQGVYFELGDALMIPFSLLWGGFAFFWEYMVLFGEQKAPLFLAFWGIPFCLVGSYLIAGRFFASAWLRSKTFYAVTNRRVLIKRMAFKKEQLIAYELTHLPPLTITKSGEFTTIQFGTRISGGRGPQVAPRFEQITGGERVASLLALSH